MISGNQFGDKYENDHDIVFLSHTKPWICYSSEQIFLVKSILWKSINQIVFYEYGFQNPQFEEIALVSVWYAVISRDL